jgi:glycerophosphoryl diester phosphodiesterase
MIIKPRCGRNRTTFLHPSAPSVSSVSSVVKWFYFFTTEVTENTEGVLTIQEFMFELVAHRGASKEAPENTMAALQAALNIGVDYIEIDVHLSKDGIPVVIHDAVLGRTVKIDPPDRVTNLDYKTLADLDAGSWYKESFSKEKIPTLDEVLSLDRGNAGLMIEIKKGVIEPDLLVAALIKSLQKTSLSKIILGSFSIPILNELNRQLPAASLIGIVENLNELPPMREMKLKKMALWYKLINPAIVQSLHDEGTEVWTFTVDDLRVAKFLISIGVHGLITNDPRHLKTLKK